MSICEIFPDDPTCAVAEPEPVAADPTVEDADVVEEEGEADVEEVVEEGEDDAEPEMKVDNSEAAAKAIADWENIKDMKAYAGYSPFMAYLSWASIVAMWATKSGLDAFRFRSKSTYYDFAKIGDDTNYYKLGDQVRLYSGLAIGGILTITSLLSAFGIAQNFNGLTWMYLIIGDSFI